MSGIIAFLIITGFVFVYCIVKSYGTQKERAGVADERKEQAQKQAEVVHEQIKVLTDHSRESASSSLRKGEF